ncbi:hypothetical protein G6549_00465 [Bacillus sp. MM2020_1]|nr:hypothetical protein [Bacillus sp. MM2020_1]
MEAIKWKTPSSYKLAGSQIEMFNKGRGKTVRAQRKLLILALISSTLVILNGFFQWNLIEIITPFLMMPVWLVVFGFFIVITMKLVLFYYTSWASSALLQLV